MDTTGRRWTHGVLGVQLGALALLALACSRAPAGIEADRYSVDGLSASASSATGNSSTEGSESEAPEVDEPIGGSATQDVTPDSNLYNPPTHSAASRWHVLDTNWGPASSLHRLATQWHNSQTNWWFWVPVTPPIWRGPYVGTVPSTEPNPGGSTGTDSGSGTITS